MEVAITSLFPTCPCVLRTSMAETTAVIADYDYTYVMRLCDQLEEPTVDINTLLFKAIKEDGIRNPAPFKRMQK